jgi:spore germination protein KB
LGADISARQTYPSFILGGKLNSGDFLERIEVIVAIIWVLTVYFKGTICYYGLSLGVAQVFGLKNYKIILYPWAFLIVVYAIFSHPDSVHFHNFLVKTWTSFSLTIYFFYHFYY